MERKCRRMQARTRAKFRDMEPQSDVEFSDAPTTCLYVGNGGLDCGVGSADLMKAFSLHGPVERIVLERRKPFGFVKMKEICQAVEAFEALNGKKITDSSPIIYLSYVNNLPDNDAVLHSKVRLPPGLCLYPDFITSDEEELLMKVFDEMPVKSNGLRHRRVSHYGYEFFYGMNDVDVTRPLDKDIPKELDFVIERMMNLDSIQWKPNQLTVNDYEPGQGIPAHVDTHSAFEDAICSLSLHSQVVMDFRHPNGSTCSVLLQPKSFLIMTGESRYIWTHGITPRKTDVIDGTVFAPNEKLLTSVGSVILHRKRRVSLTFRTVRGRPCECDFPAYCDRKTYRQHPE
ncbi:alkylated DNA repair protein alkB homolog 8-like isoform X2 [Oscarella lobularis]|uniref:alkylated DNA repair protein alkB homolog 8-like isoform X2 n=1 Tax=Oscarella lobularis TaxID=121494 RepID=UPI0033134219